MLRPKKIKRSLADVKLPRKRCENPMCNHWLPMRAVRDGKKYCDPVCYNEHQRIQGMESRPAEVLCAHCNTPIDVEKRSPAKLESHPRQFCDQLCADAYRRENGLYRAMSHSGNKAVKEYKEKHGNVPSYENRKAKVSENNKKAPPKNKNFDRKGKVWGYAVQFKGTGEDYIVTVPELPEIEAFHSKTMKDGLLAVRAKMLEIRNVERTSGKE